MNLCQNTASVQVYYMSDPNNNAQPLNFSGCGKTRALNFCYSIIFYVLCVYYIIPDGWCFKEAIVSSLLILLLACSHEFILHFCALRKLDSIFGWLPTTLCAQAITFLYLAACQRAEPGIIISCYVEFWLTIDGLRTVVIIGLRLLHVSKALHWRELCYMLWKPT